MSAGDRDTPMTTDRETEIADLLVGHEWSPEQGGVVNVTDTIEKALREHQHRDKFDRQGLSVSVSHVCTCGEWQHESGGDWQPSHRKHQAAVIAQRLEAK